MSEHISKQFDADLEAIRSHVMSMAGLVEEQVRLAMKALSSGDADLIRQVQEQEARTAEFLAQQQAAEASAARRIPR